jgi:acetoin utilization deacetylase AcuC-like enzyme
MDYSDIITLMILYDKNLNMKFRDYGIMLPIADTRAKRILEYIGLNESSATSLDSARRIAGIIPNSITREDIERVHSARYAEALFGDEKSLENALLTCYELIGEDGRFNRYEPESAAKPLTDIFKTTLLQVYGAYAACRLALKGGNSLFNAKNFCYYLGGGSHHARYDEGSGFCLINDSIIAARKLQTEKSASLIWIIDVDAHKGDGSAELANTLRRHGELSYTKGNDIIILSVHMAGGWPLDEPHLKRSLRANSFNYAPFAPSDLDIPIAEGEEELYNLLLSEGLLKLERLSPVKADLAVVIDGADPYIKDELPSASLLRLTLDQMLERDRIIFDFLQKRSIPSAWLMAGGYGDAAWEPAAYFLKSLLRRG